MARRDVLLVNPNRMRPPIAPLGFEYVAAALDLRGYTPHLCDLTFADDWRPALTDTIEDVRPVAVLFSVRNIDDAYFASQDFVLKLTGEMVRYAMQTTDAPVILGGVGFSIAPCETLRYTGATHGIVGEGEDALPQLLDCLAAGGETHDVPGAVFWENDRIVAVPPVFCRLSGLPTPSRRFVDNRRYFAERGQAGIETKRGCDRSCIYCVEPHAKGNAIRLRTPESVAAEFADLLDQGVDVVHLCDSEFNLPIDHAYGVCRALVDAGLASRVRWYTYAAPQPFDADLAHTMARAGCAGINFGVDHGDPDMLRRLGREYSPDDLRRTAQACRDADIAVMFDMLLGSPGETRDSLARAIDLMREIAPDRVGLSCGVRLYPHTPLARMVRRQGPLAANPNLHGVREDNEDFLRPIFYVDAALGPDIHRIVSELVAGDPRFFHADPSQLDGNYNYNDNSVLSNAIRSGARGAYWDILRRLAGSDAKPR